MTLNSPSQRGIGPTAEQATLPARRRLLAAWQLFTAQRIYCISAIIHVGGLLVAMAVPVPPAAAAVQPVVIELADIAPPPPPPPATPSPPAPEPEQAPKAEPPPPSPAAAPVQAPPKSPPAKAVRRARASAPAAGPATAGTAGPGEAGIRSLGGEFSGGGDEAPAPEPTRPAAEHPAVASEKAKDECNEPLVKAKPLQVPTPAYPESEREAGIAGKVRIQISLSADGQVQSAKLLEGLGEPFDSAALAAAKAAAFEPASRCGKSVASTFTLGIRFTP